jgi:hypothetical protein
MYGIEPRQFKFHVVMPVIDYLGYDLTIITNQIAVNLVLGTCLKESLLKFIIQRPNGPALGVGQMEPFTHDDLWKTFLPGRFELRQKVLRILGRSPGDEKPPPSTDLIGNMSYAIAMTRIKYIRARPPLPANTPLALAQYWKNHYNTVEGKGDVNEALKHFTYAVNL